jgi:hypothetical protein
MSVANLLSQGLNNSMYTGPIQAPDQIDRPVMPQEQVGEVSGYTEPADVAAPVKPLTEQVPAHGPSIPLSKPKGTHKPYVNTTMQQPVPKTEFTDGELLGDPAVDSMPKTAGILCATLILNRQKRAAASGSIMDLLPANEQQKHVTSSQAAAKADAAQPSAYQKALAKFKEPAKPAVPPPAVATKP